MSGIPSVAFFAVTIDRLWAIRRTRVIGGNDENHNFKQRDAGDSEQV